jgi:hypothetical protein
MPDDVNANYRKWLIEEIDILERYHNHKETMAWTVTAFYIPGIIILCYYAGTAVKLCWITSILVTILISILTYAVLVFANMQFSKRWEADEILIGLRRIMTKLSNGWTPSQEDRKLKLKTQWPKFVENEIDKAQDPRYLPQALKDIFSRRVKTLNPKWKTEIPSYLAIIIAFVIAIALLWAI